MSFHRTLSDRTTCRSTKLPIRDVADAVRMMRMRKRSNIFYTTVMLGFAPYYWMVYRS